MCMQSFIPDTGSRYAEVDEIIRNAVKINCSDDVFDAGGVPVYSDGRTAYVMNNDCHSFICASTGSKKSRNIVMPTIATLIKHGESMVVHDLKAEIIKRYSGLLAKHGYNVIVLNFRDPTTGSRWNPLSTVHKLKKARKLDRAIMYLRDVGMCIYSEQTNLSQDKFWGSAATDYFVGLGLLLLNEVDEDMYTIENIRVTHTVGNKSLSNTSVTNLKKYMDFIGSSSETAANLSSVYMPSDTRGGVHAVFAQPLSLYSQENLCDMMCRSDFELSSIGTEKTAVFLITPDERSQYHPLVSLFIKLCYQELIDTAESEGCNGTLPYRVTFVIDEFSNIPPVPDMASMISAARSRNIRFNLVCQNLGQIYKSYSTEIAETIISNCDIWHILRSMDYRLHELVQKMCGTHVSEHLNTERSLVDTMTIQRLNKERGEVIIKMLGQFPFITELPDIDDYEFNVPKGEDVVFKKRRPIKRKLFDFEEVLMRHKNKEMQEAASKLEKELLSTEADSLVIEDVLPHRQNKMMETIRKIFPPKLIDEENGKFDIDDMLRKIDEEIEKLDALIEEGDLPKIDEE